jgi:hypothetical protein
MTRGRFAQRVERPPNFSSRNKAESSIRVQEGEPPSIRFDSIRSPSLSVLLFACFQPDALAQQAALWCFPSFDFKFMLRVDQCARLYQQALTLVAAATSAEVHDHGVPRALVDLPLPPTPRTVRVEPSHSEEHVDRADVVLNGERRLSSPDNTIAEREAILPAHPMMIAYWPTARSLFRNGAPTAIRLHLPRPYSDSSYTPRPWVAARNRRWVGWICRSNTGASGNPFSSGLQFRPASPECHTPMSAPT